MSSSNDNDIRIELRQKKLVARLKPEGTLESSNGKVWFSIKSFCAAALGRSIGGSDNSSIEIYHNDHFLFTYAAMRDYSQNFKKIIGRNWLRKLYSLIVEEVIGREEKKQVQTSSTFIAEPYSFEQFNKKLKDMKQEKSVVFGSSVHGNEFNENTVKDITTVTIYEGPSDDAVLCGLAGLGIISVVDAELAAKHSINTFGKQSCFLVVHKNLLPEISTEKWIDLLLMQLKLFPRLEMVRIVCNKDISEKLEPKLKSLSIPINYFDISEIENSTTEIIRKGITKLPTEFESDLDNFIEKARIQEKELKDPFVLNRLKLISLKKEHKIETIDEAVEAIKIIELCNAYKRKDEEEHLQLVTYENLKDFNFVRTEKVKYFSLIKEVGNIKVIGTSVYYPTSLSEFLENYWIQSSYNFIGNLPKECTCYEPVEGGNNFIRIIIHFSRINFEPRNYKGMPDNMGLLQAYRKDSHYFAELHTHLLGMGDADFWINFIMKTYLPDTNNLENEVIIKCSSLASAFQLSNSEESEIIEFLGNIFGVKSTPYNIDNQRSKTLEWERGYKLSEIIAAYDKTNQINGQDNPARYYLRKSFEMTHVAENRGKFTPNFYPQKYILKDDLYFQRLDVLTMVLIHTIIQYAINDVNYVEYSISYKDLKNDHIYQYLTPKKVLEVWNIINVKYLTYLNTIRTKKKLPLINTLSLENKNEKEPIDLQVKLIFEDQESKTIPFKYYFLCAFNRKDVAVYPEDVNTDKKKMEFLSKLELKDIHNEKIYEKFLSEKEGITKLFTNLSDSYISLSTRPKPPLCGAIVGLDWVGDERLYPFCAFITKFVKHLAKAYYMKTGFKLGLRYHCGENVFLDDTGNIFTSHMDITYTNIELMVDKYVNLRLGHGVGFLLHDNQSDQVISELSKRMASYVKRFPNDIYFEWCPTSNVYLLHSFHNVPFPQKTKVVVATDNDGIMPIGGMLKEVDYACSTVKNLDEQLLKNNSQSAKFIRTPKSFNSNTITIYGIDKDCLNRAKNTLIEKYGSPLSNDILIGNLLLTIKQKRTKRYILDSLDVGSIVALDVMDLTEELEMNSEKLTADNLYTNNKKWYIIEDKIICKNVAHSNETQDDSSNTSQDQVQ